jgi:hypothetical protein
MKAWLRALGFRRQKYSSHIFSVEIKTMVRGGVSIVYKREGITLELGGERTGRNWERIQVSIPLDIDLTQASQVARDLVTALNEMNYEYDITRGLETLARSKRP